HVLAMCDALAITLEEGTAAVVADGTRRLRSEPLRFRDNAIVQAILEHLDEGIALADPDGSLVYVTPPFARLLGLPSEPLLGLRPGASLDQLRRALALRAESGEPLPTAELPWLRALASQRAVLGQSLRLRRADSQEEVLCEASAVPMFDAERRLRG